MPNIFMIGHSNYDLEQFRSMLFREKITVVYDIRLMPFSRYVPQYNQTTLPEKLAEWGIVYCYKKELGPRVEGDEPLYEKGLFHYERALKRKRIIDGIKEIINENAEETNIAIMATKKEPLECHRFLVLTPVLQEMGLSVSHILPDETLSSTVCEQKLIETMNRRIKRKTFTPLPTGTPLEQAYYAQSEKISKIGMKKFANLRKKVPKEQL